MQELWFNAKAGTGLSSPSLPMKGERRVLNRRNRPIDIRNSRPVKIEAERLERRAVRDKDYLDCSKELGLDKKIIDITKIEDFDARRKALGILPQAPYGCMTQECEEQNRASSKSEIDFQNSELGKQFDCLDKCHQNKIFLRESNAGLASLKRKGKDPSRSIQMIDTINYRYNSECPSFKKTNYLPWVLGGVVILLLLKK